jgi:hypothetical protein
MKRSILFHLFRLYGFKQSKEYDNNMNVLYKGFKRMVAEEVQQGGGKIQNGKSSMTYGLYRSLNIYFLKQNFFRVHLGEGIPDPYMEPNVQGYQYLYDSFAPYRMV